MKLGIIGLVLIIGSPPTALAHKVITQSQGNSQLWIIFPIVIGLALIVIGLFDAFLIGNSDS